MLIQLCYASERVEHLNSDLLEDLSNILTKSNLFNQEQQIFGVLYYANGFFFQCLEGEKSQVEALFVKIQDDKRHHKIKLYRTVIIDEINFKSWSMKYVEKNTCIERFFHKRGKKNFQPLELLQEDIASLLEVLIDSIESELPKRTRQGLKYRGVNRFL
ncbi:blue light sensor protein [Acinetobacter radioresistens]|nr:BLUF domain-containing protein [Acinetobacter radioresistens]MCU4597214.1 BLUF domain-containing protein [Acinetobacter radioresistens]PSD34798.1 blue light sensor protein [Acinetobacter radioresistens]PSD36562.1 blue light sensor protein [Acinetobacter radioresistens]